MDRSHSKGLLWIVGLLEAFYGGKPPRDLEWIEVF